MSVWSMQKVSNPRRNHRPSILRKHQPLSFSPPLCARPGAYEADNFVNLNFLCGLLIIFIALNKIFCETKQVCKIIWAKDMVRRTKENEWVQNCWSNSLNWTSGLIIINGKRFGYNLQNHLNKYYWIIKQWLRKRKYTCRWAIACYI